MKIIRPWTLASLLLVAGILACIATPTPPPPPPQPAVPPAAPPAAALPINARTTENGDVVEATVIENPPVWMGVLKVC
jgi:hypothetical protein